MTRLEEARAGIITTEMKEAALGEGVEPEFIRKGMADGNIIITRSRLREDIKPLAVGQGLRTKVNANIGSSQDASTPEEELEKLMAAEAAGAELPGRAVHVAVPRTKPARADHLPQTLHIVGQIRHNTAPTDSRWGPVRSGRQARSRTRASRSTARRRVSV